MGSFYVLNLMLAVVVLSYKHGIETEEQEALQMLVSVVVSIRTSNRYCFSFWGLDGSILQSRRYGTETTAHLDTTPCTDYS